MFLVLKLSQRHEGQAGVRFAARMGDRFRNFETHGRVGLRESNFVLKALAGT